MACGAPACVERRRREAAARAAANGGVEQPEADVKGSWSVTFLNGKKTYHPSRLAAFAAEVKGRPENGQGMVRPVR
jgi:hypothetical protein